MKKDNTKSHEYQDSLLEGEVLLASLLPNSISDLILSTPEAGWAEFHADSNTTSSIELPIEGNEYAICYKTMTDRAARCIARFFALLQANDDIRIFTTQSNAYFFVTKIEEHTVFRVLELMRNAYGYSPKLK